MKRILTIVLILCMGINYIPLQTYAEELYSDKSDIELLYEETNDLMESLPLEEDVLPLPILEEQRGEKESFREAGPEGTIHGFIGVWLEHESRNDDFPAIAFFTVEENGKHLSRNETVHFKVSFLDQDGIDSVQLRFGKDTETDYPVLMGYSEKSGCFEGMYTFTGSEPAGQYYVTYCMAIDSLGCYSEFTNEKQQWMLNFFPGEVIYDADSFLDEDLELTEEWITELPEEFMAEEKLEDADTLDLLEEELEIDLLPEMVLQELTEVKELLADAFVFEFNASRDSGNTVNLSGTAPAGAKITVTDERLSELAVYTADENGEFSGEVVIESWQPLTGIALQAVCVSGSDRVSRTVGLFRPQEYSLSVFRYYDNAENDEFIDINQALQEGTPVSICYTGYDGPFKFVLGFADGKHPDHVYVTASSTTKKYRIEALYDAESDTYIARGVFDQNRTVDLDSFNVEISTESPLAAIQNEAPDIGAGSLISSAVYNDFPDLTVTKEETADQDEVSYVIDLYSEYDDKVINGIRYVEKQIDKATGMELFSAYQAKPDVLSYDIPDLTGGNGNRYYMNIDLSDPNEIRALLVCEDMAATLTDKAYQFIFSQEIQSDYTMLDLGDRISKVSSAISLVTDMADISLDTEELRQQIATSMTMTDDERNTAYEKADQLDQERKAFAILCAILPAVAATVGSGGLAAPVALFAAGINMLAMSSDFVYEKRTDSILEQDKQKLIIGYNDSGAAEMIGRDGLLYRVDYHLGAITEKPNMYDPRIVYKHARFYMNITVTGKGTMSRFDDSVYDIYQPIVNKYSEMDIYIDAIVARRAIIEEGITTISGQVGRYFSLYKVVLPRSLRSAEGVRWSGYLYSVGPTEEYALQYVNSGLFNPGELINGENRYTKIVLGAGTKLKGSTFGGCKALEKVVFLDCSECEGRVSWPSTFRTVGPNYSSDVVILMDSIPRKMFSGFSTLEQAVLPVHYIGNEAFSGCKNLKTVVITGDAVSIGDSAFRGCTVLDTLVLPGMTTIGGNAFSDAVLLEMAGPVGGDYNVGIDYGTTIAERGFYSIPLKSIVIPDSIEVIGAEAFMDSTLEEIMIPNSVKEIGASAFRGSSLKEVTLPKDLKEISEGCFGACENLSAIRMPDGIKSVGKDALYWCPMLKEIEIPNSVESIGNSAFRHCEALVRVKMPNELKIIGEYAFQECSNLQRIDLSKTKLQTIERDAFSACASLTEVKLPGTLRTIGNSAFEETNIKEINIPDGVETIGIGAFGAFNDCLTEKIWLPVSLKYIGAMAFGSVKKADVYYAGTKEQWKELDYDFYSEEVIIHFLGTSPTPTPIPPTPTPSAPPSIDSNIYSFVYRCYSEALGRTAEEIQADADGVMYWYNNIKGGLISADHVGYYFVFSPEGASKGQSNYNFVTMLYRLYMNRIPDTGGLSYWDTLLNNGTLTREDVNWWFCESAEWQGIKAEYGIKWLTIQYEWKEYFLY